ncbi:hypothetical protein JJQ97_00650 [Pseudomonas syringae]|nr:hypothetical protein JJQ97_00650 [Pseudomonas syringae]
MIIYFKGIFMKLAKLFATTVLFTSMVAAAHAGTIVTVKVKNSTTGPAEYTYEYFSGSVSPSPSTILPSATTTFALTSVADTVSGMRLVYTSGTKKCRFAATHQVNPSSNVPSWTKTGTSIGSSNATCSAKITAVQASLPYNYTVEFEIR